MGILKKLFGSRSGSFTCARCSRSVVTAAENRWRKEQIALKYGLAINEDGDVYRPMTARSGGSGADIAVEIARRNVEDAQIQREVNQTPNNLGFRCRSCGAVYCMTCLENYAPPHPGTGGKACPKCGGSFMVFEG